MRITDTWLRTSKPRQTRYEVNVDGRTGLVVRVHPSGAKSFRFRYMRGGERQWLVFGEYGEGGLTLANAFDMHRQAQRDLAMDLDPIDEHKSRLDQAERLKERQEAVDGIGIRNVIAEWAWHYARKNRKRPREAVRLLKVNIAKPWKGKAINDLRRRDAVLLLDQIVKRGSKVMANRVRDLGNQAFTFCASRDLIERNPFLAIPRPGGEEVSSNRWLTNEEIRTFWAALDDPKNKISRRLALAFRLVLVTAQRPGEVALARVSEFDLVNGVWTIPPEHIKTEPAENGRPHVVPLSTLAIELIKELIALAGERPCLLPSSRSRQQWDQPINEKTLAHTLSDCIAEVDGSNPTLFGMETFSPHDLRRTASTHITSLNIPRLHLSKVLNHSDEKTTGIYDRWKYWKQKKRALNKWERELVAILAGKKTVGSPQA